MSSSSSINHSTARKHSSRFNLFHLPDELLLNCLARIPRLYDRTLWSVSKRFRSLLTSTELYQTRKLLGCTESCLYVCFLSESNPCWFILRRRPPNPNTIPNLNKSSDNVLVSVPTRNYPLKHVWKNLIAVGSNIYMIGEDIKYSSRVFIMDCRSHTWLEAPSMQVARMNPSTSVLDGKIYVVGGIDDYNSSNWIECFDPKTQKWEHVPIPDADIPKRYILKSFVMERNLYLVMGKSMVYRPKENRWDAVGSEMNLVRYDMRLDSTSDSFCVIDNVLYCYGSSERLEWYDSEARSWRFLKGVEELTKPPSLYFSCVRLVNYSGKIAVLWEKMVNANGLVEINIWCAEISLERSNRHEIYGKVEWHDVVHKTPKSCDLKKFISLTV